MRHSRGVTKSDAKNSSIPRIRPRFHNRVRSPQSGLFPALSPAAHRHGSYVSVCEGSERQQGGRLTYTLHSFRFCAESVLTAVDRAGSTATCVPQSTRRRVDPSLRTLDQPQRSQPPPPESAHPTICATRWSATSRVRRLCGERYQRGGPACSRQRPGSGEQFTASQAGSSATTGHSREPAAG